MKAQELKVVSALSMAPTRERVDRISCLKQAVVGFMIILFPRRFPAFDSIPYYALDTNHEIIIFIKLSPIIDI